MPPIDVRVALRPGETEVIDSNLDSEQTAQLLEKARLAFEREVRADTRLQQRARDSAERALRALLVTVNGVAVDYDPGPLARAVLDGDVVVTEVV